MTIVYRKVCIVKIKCGGIAPPRYHTRISVNILSGSKSLNIECLARTTIAALLKIAQELLRRSSKTIGENFLAPRVGDAISINRHPFIAKTIDNVTDVGYLEQRTTLTNGQSITVAEPYRN